MVELHFKDLTGIMTDAITGDQIYYMDEKGRTEKIREGYECKGKRKKGKKFKKIVEKLSGGKEK